MTSIVRSFYGSFDWGPFYVDFLLKLLTFFWKFQLFYCSKKKEETIKSSNTCSINNYACVTIKCNMRICSIISPRNWTNEEAKCENSKWFKSCSNLFKKEYNTIIFEIYMYIRFCIYVDIWYISPHLRGLNFYTIVTRL